MQSDRRNGISGENAVEFRPPTKDVGGKSDIVLVSIVSGIVTMRLCSRLDC